MMSSATKSASRSVVDVQPVQPVSSGSGAGVDREVEASCHRHLVLQQRGRYSGDCRRTEQAGRVVLSLYPAIRRRSWHRYTIRRARPVLAAQQGRRRAVRPYPAPPVAQSPSASRIPPASMYWSSSPASTRRARWPTHAGGGRRAEGSAGVAVSDILAEIDATLGCQQCGQSRLVGRRRLLFRSVSTHLARRPRRRNAGSAVHVGYRRGDGR